MWGWTVLFVLTVLTIGGESYPKGQKSLPPNRNQRIIKVQGAPHYNHFKGHHKPIRNRPFKGHIGDDFIRPNHPPPIPPFFNGPSTNHVKHLPRPPPPHVFHKAPSYGIGFPYKIQSNFRPQAIPLISKEQHFRIPTVSVPTISIPPLSLQAGSIPTAVRSPQSIPSVQILSTPLVKQTSSSLLSSSSSSSSSTSSSHSATSSASYHKPTFASSPYIASPVGPIINSDDNNGPIREIPAPNLGPGPGPKHKPYDTSFGASAISAVGNVGGVSSISSIGSSGGVSGISSVGSLGGASGISSVGSLTSLGTSSGISSIGSISGSGSISGVGSAGSLTSLDGIASAGHLDTTSYSTSFKKNPGFDVHGITKDSVDLSTVLKNSGYNVNTFLKEETGDISYTKEPSEITNYDQDATLDITNLLKETGPSDFGTTYEVREPHLPSNDQLFKGHDGSKLYYAPDPDPSLPVHKVPPTSDPHSTPSNGDRINPLFLQGSQGFSYLQGGGLSSQELYHLMHGYPTAVYPQPIVAFVGQPQSTGVLVSGGGPNYFPQTGGEVVGYTQGGQYGGDDIRQYLQQPDIHNLLHNTPHEQDTLESSHSQPQATSSSKFHNYGTQKFQNDYQQSDSGSSEITHNFHYEPEASESQSKNSLTVIRQTNEGSLGSDKVKELLIEESSANELNFDKGSDSSTIIQLKNAPEVPFYTTLPNKEAAEALASLQAAGSVASTYINRIKVSRGDQEADDERTQERKGKAEEGGSVSSVTLPKPLRVGYSTEKSEESEQSKEKTVVDIQQSVPVYESNVSSQSLTETDNDKQTSGEVTSGEEQDREDNVHLEFERKESNETFGKRLRPK